MNCRVGRKEYYVHGYKYSEPTQTLAFSVSTHNQNHKYSAHSTILKIIKNPVGSELANNSHLKRVRAKRKPSTDITKNYVIHYS